MTGKRGHAVAQRRVEAADRGANRRKAVSSPPTRSSTPTPATSTDALLQLQALAGNRAVSELMDVVAQRAPAQAPAEITDADVAAMTPLRRLGVAMGRAEVSLAVREKLLSLMSEEALVGAIIAFAAVWVASQFTPVGWAADLLTWAFIGTAVVNALVHLVNFAAGRNAKTKAELDQASWEFAQAMAGIEVDTFIFLLTKKIGESGGKPLGGPPAAGAQVVLATPGGGAYYIPVLVSTIPANVAVQIGVLGAGTGAGLSMMAANAKGGPAGGSRTGDSPPKSGGAPRETPAEGGWDEDAILKEFEEAQEKAGPGALEKDALEQPGVSNTRTPGGAPQPERFEVGNFGHRYAEQLIPESEMPRGLEPEFSIKDGKDVIGRPDRLDRDKGFIYEVKPNTPKWVAIGKKAIERYIFYLNKFYPRANGKSWEGKVVTYSYEAARRILFGK